MPQQRTGRFTSGPNKGRFWEVYPDPLSATGWSRKIWDSYDPAGTEYFEPFDAAAADVDEEAAQRAAASRAARDQSTAASRQAFVDSDTAYRNSTLAYRDKRNSVADDQWDRTFQETQNAREDRREQAREALREQRRQFDASYGLNVRAADRADQQLGADLLKTGATMRGPLNAFQGFAYSQGVAQGPLSNYVRAVYGGTGPNYGGGTATGGSPTPLTVGSLAREMTGAGGGGMSSGGFPNTTSVALGASGTASLDALGRTLTPEQQAYLAPIKEAAEAGLANKGLGWWENQTKGQQAAYTSGSDFIGRDTESDLEYYKRSRPGQRSGRLA